MTIIFSDKLGRFAVSGVENCVYNSENNCYNVLFEDGGEEVYTETRLEEIQK